ncbi:MAG TPA: ThuA domain-containing protein [Bryobacteraceae bacterium]|nr:ThuA domain-containing protein [Bryobacteraceae bacterium]
MHAALVLGLALLVAPAPIRVLILTGHSDPAHDWRTTTPAIVKILEGSGGFTVKAAEDVNALAAADLAAFDVLVLNYNGPRWAPPVERAIEEFVASGKGLLSLHGVTYGEFYGQRMVDGRWIAGDAGWPAYPKLIGAMWDPAKIGHGARHQFKVKWVDRQHPVAKGAEESFVADDELYHRITLLPDTRVLASAYSAPATRGTGQDEPIIWTAPFGKGRTIHLTLGHDVRALGSGSVAAALVRSACWAAAN